MTAGLAPAPPSAVLGVRSHQGAPEPVVDAWELRGGGGGHRPRGGRPGSIQEEGLLLPSGGGAPGAWLPPVSIPGGLRPKLGCHPLSLWALGTRGGTRGLQCLAQTAKNLSHTWGPESASGAPSLSAYHRTVSTCISRSPPHLWASVSLYRHFFPPPSLSLTRSLVTLSSPCTPPGFPTLSRLGQGRTQPPGMLLGPSLPGQREAHGHKRCPLGSAETSWNPPKKISWETAGKQRPNNGKVRGSKRERPSGSPARASPGLSLSLAPGSIPGGPRRPSLFPGGHWQER